MDTDEKLLARFIEGHPSEVAQRIENYPEKEIVSLLQSLPVNLSVLLLSQIERSIAARCLLKMDMKIAIKLIENMTVSTAEVLLRQVDIGFSDAILKELPKQISVPLREVLNYPKNSIGSFTNPGVFTLDGDKTIKEGLGKIRKNNPVIGAQIFVIDRDQSLIGYIELQQLITNDTDKLIRSIAKSQLPRVLADMNISSLSEFWKNNEFTPYLPVINSGGKFIGVIGKDALSKTITRKGPFDLRAMQTSNALSDLYKIGLSSLFLSTAEFVGNHDPK